MLHYLRRLASEKKTAQVLALYLTMGFSIVLSIGISVINTHALGPDGFGDLKFLQTLFSFVLTSTTLGFFVSGGRLIAKEHDALHISVLTGALLIITLILYIFIMSVLLVLSYSEITVFRDGLGRLVRLVLPLLLALPLQICLESSLKGQNRIYGLALLRIVPGALYLIAAMLITRFSVLTVDIALSLYLGTIGLTGLVLAVQTRPVFIGVFNAISVIIKEVRGYGIHVYVGIVANVGTTLLGGILLAFFLNTTSAGYFILARTIAMPLSLISTNIGTVFFRSFAQTNKISSQVFIITILTSLITLACFLLVISDFIDYVYPREFNVIVQLVYIIAFGATVQGLGGFINQFLCANGYGRKTRNAAITQGVLNCFGFTVLVYYWGTYGAAITVALGSMGFLLIILHYYRQVVSHYN